MITKPKAFIYRLDRNNGSAFLLDSSKVISIEIDTDLNKRCVIVKTSDYSIFEDDNSTITYNFITCMNYKGVFIDRFWKLYMKNVNSIMPKGWISKRNEICQNHNLLQYSDADYPITTNRCFTDMVMARKYVNGDGIYTFEFIPITQDIFTKAPLIPDDSEAELQEYSKASGITVGQIKQDVWRKFGYKYSDFTPTGEQTNKLSFKDIQDHIRMMLLRYLNRYGIKCIDNIIDFDSVSDFGKITAVSGVTLNALIDKLRRSFSLRIWQEYPNYNLANEFHKFIIEHLIMTVEPPLTKNDVNSLGKQNLTLQQENITNDSINISYTTMVKKYGIAESNHLYDLFTDISCKDDENDRNNALLVNASVNLATGIKLKVVGVVELKSFSNNTNYDVYLQSILINNSNISVSYGTKYILRQYRNGVMSELPLTADEFQKHLLPKPSSSIVMPLPSPYDNVMDVSNVVILNGIEKSIDTLCDNIKYKSSSIYKLELEFTTPLFQQGVANLIYVAQLYPYNTNGKKREDYDGVLYIASIDRIIETIDDNGYVFNVHCSTGQKIEEIKL